MKICSLNDTIYNYGNNSLKKMSALIWNIEWTCWCREEGFKTLAYYTHKWLNAILTVWSHGSLHDLAWKHGIICHVTDSNRQDKRFIVLKLTMTVTLTTFIKWYLKIFIQFSYNLAIYVTNSYISKPHFQYGYHTDQVILINGKFFSPYSPSIMLYWNFVKKKKINCIKMFFIKV